MRLSDLELHAMNTPLRRAGQRWFELPLFRHLGLDANNKDVLEIGCGSGYGGYLLNQMKPRSYVGLDLMEEQVVLARRNYPDFQFILQDVVNLSHFPASSHDMIVIFGVLHHIPAWRNVLEEIARLLRPGGDLFLEEPRGVDLKLFDFFFRWGHPDSDFGLIPLEEYLKTCKLAVVKKQWTPILTSYYIKKLDPHG